jgi:hypothetical protein
MHMQRFCHLWFLCCIDALYVLRAFSVLLVNIIIMAAIFGPKIQHARPEAMVVGGTRATFSPPSGTFMVRSAFPSAPASTLNSHLPINGHNNNNNNNNNNTSLRGGNHSPHQSGQAINGIQHTLAMNATSPASTTSPSFGLQLKQLPSKGSHGGGGGSGTFPKPDSPHGNPSSPVIHRTGSAISNDRMRRGQSSPSPLLSARSGQLTTTAAAVAAAATMAAAATPTVLSPTTPLPPVLPVPHPSVTPLVG